MKENKIKYNSNFPRERPQKNSVTHPGNRLILSHEDRKKLYCPRCETSYPEKYILSEERSPVLYSSSKVRGYLSRYHLS